MPFLHALAHPAPRRGGDARAPPGGAPPRPSPPVPLRHWPPPSEGAGPTAALWARAAPIGREARGRRGRWSAARPGGGAEPPGAGRLGSARRRRPGPFRGGTGPSGAVGGSARRGAVAGRAACAEGESLGRVEVFRRRAGAAGGAGGRGEIRRLRSAAPPALGGGVCRGRRRKGSALRGPWCALPAWDLRPPTGLPSRVCGAVRCGAHGGAGRHRVTACCSAAPWSLCAAWRLVRVTIYWFSLEGTHVTKFDQVLKSQK